MGRNIIDIFSIGNQELFHSAFLGWLLRDKEDHGLGKLFRSQLLAALPNQILCDRNGDYAVDTEVRSGSSRFDIVLEPSDNVGQKKLVFENKVKSFGNCIQLDKYHTDEHYVIVLALLPETLDDETRGRYPILTYRFIRDLLRKFHLDASNPYQFIVLQYLQFLERTLGTYETISAYCGGAMKFEDAMDRLSDNVVSLTFRDNDIRTFNYFYYYTLAEFIKTSAADLAFGTLPYEEAETANENTRWLFEKNMQGPPFMEAIIRRPFDTPHWTLHQAFLNIHQTTPLQIAPRIEIWLNPTQLIRERSEKLEIGKIMLGTWNANFKSALRSQEPYKSILKRRGDRNFHYEPLTLVDLPFSSMVQRIRQIMMLIFDYSVT